MIVSFTIIRYRTIFIPFAFLAMAIHRFPLWLNRKCTFWKLMGSGRNGSFDLRPDLKQWALLACWKEPADFEQFTSGSFISQWWKFLAEETFTILCEPLTSHGKWDGNEPFKTIEKIDNPEPVAVLTRATIRLSKLKAFWSNVDNAASEMPASPGYIVSFGVGEAPFYRQATFSIWDNVEAVKNFAYRSKKHSTVIARTRAENWYSEELFARFRIVSSTGSLNGVNPLKNKL